MKVVAVLALFVAVAQAGKMYRWRRDSNWLNNDNWEGGQAPINGHISVRFPGRFSTFNNGKGGAVYLGPTNCASGASTCDATEQDFFNDENSRGQGFRQEVRVRRVVLPRSGKLALASTFRINFAAKRDNIAEREVTFRMPSTEHMDWQCAANWVYLRETQEPFADGNVRQSIISNGNTALEPPCVEDHVYFPSRSSFLVQVPDNSFINAIFVGNPYTATIGGGDAESLNDLENRFDFQHQLGSARSGRTALTSANFQPTMCPHQCPTVSTDLRSADHCESLCYNTCPGSGDDADVCDSTSCPREAVLNGLLTKLNAQYECTVPLYAVTRTRLFQDNPQAPYDFIFQSNGYTQANIQQAANDLVSRMRGRSDANIRSIGVSVSGQNVDLQVQGFIPKTSDNCLSAYHAGVSPSESGCSQGENPWFTSGPSSENSRVLRERLTPALEVLAMSSACQAYALGGDYALGYCWCSDETGLCDYANRADAELDCVLNYGVSCENVNTYEITVPVAVNTDLSVSRADVEAAINAQVCNLDACAVARNGVFVGEIGSDGTVNVRLTVLAAEEPNSNDILTSIQDGMALSEISLAVEEAQAAQLEGSSGSSQSASTSITGTSGGDGAVFAAIGAVVVVGVVVVYMKKNQNQPASRKADRNVVAFENPMYADEKGRGNDSQGLYDEPSFNAKKNKKSNPIFGADDDDTGAGGYLDVEPDDDDE